MTHQKVLVFGTFDYFHEGHRHFLRQAKKHGDCLVVIVARDKTVQQLKGKRPGHTELERLDAVEKSGLADEVLLGGAEGDKYKVIEQVKPDVICLGYDQKFFAEGLQEELRKRGLKVKIVRLLAYKPGKYKSSIIAKGASF
jgi:FAD synthetase